MDMPGSYDYERQSPRKGGELCQELSIHPELSSINRDDYVKGVADEIEKEFENKNFDKRPPASVIAQDQRNKVPEDPEKRFIRLR